MHVENQNAAIARLPRAPFLPHSEQIVGHLIDQTTLSEAPRILEIGCGFRSPLVPTLVRRLQPGYHLHQIDARAEVIPKARQWNPDGQVEQLFINSMSSIPDNSKDLVIGMSVFDQNPASAMQPIAKEIKRVLRPNGWVIYIHNEELNAPATTASLLSLDDPQYLLPNPDWTPDNDAEYCQVAKSAVDQAIRRDDSILAKYIRAMTPPSTVSAAGKVQVPAIGKMTPRVMASIRSELAELAAQADLDLAVVPTSTLLARQVQERLFCKPNGFEVTQSAVYEIQRVDNWNKWFQERPKASFFTRGLSRFGSASDTRTPPNSDCDQQLNDCPADPNTDEVLFTAYQYGLVARVFADG